MSVRGEIIRGAGGHLKRNTNLGVGIGHPHGGAEGDIRVQMVEGSPHLYARAGGQWYGVNLAFSGVAGGATDEFRLGSSSNYITISQGDIEMTGKISIQSGGSENICIGRWHTGDPDVGTGNIILGFDSGGNLNEKTNYNTLVGTDAGKALGTSMSVADFGSENTIIGWRAGLVMTHGRHSVLVGSEAGTAITDAQYNICLGKRAGYNITGSGAGVGSHEDGGGNICIGLQAGLGLTTGRSNIYIGTGAYANGATRINTTVIGKEIGDKGDNTVVLGNNDITDIWMAFDGDAFTHCGAVYLAEQGSTPADIVTKGTLYTKSDNKLYFTDGAGTDYTVDITAV